MLEDFIKRSIDRVRLASEMSISHYGKPLVCEYSGGKDSDALLCLNKAEYRLRFIIHIPQ